MILHIKIETKFNRVMSFRPDFQIKRLTPDHIVMITSLNTWQSTCKSAALYVINTSTYKEHKKFTLNYYEASFCILPTKSSSFKNKSEFVLDSVTMVSV